MQKILIVDDENDTRDLLKKGLEKNKFDVLTASGGEEALNICKSTKPDLILLDIIMPELDGYEVCKRLRADDKTRDIPVLFLTGKDLGPEGIAELYTKLGAAGYIAKPSTFEEILKKIKGVIG